MVRRRIMFMLRWNKYFEDWLMEREVGVSIIKVYSWYLAYMG